MSALTAEQALAAWGNLESDDTSGPDPQTGIGAAPVADIEPRYKTPYRLYRPLADAADGFIREAQDSKRIYLGVDAFDEQMRGIGAGHLCMIQGYSHQGKTLLLLHALRHNRERKVAMFIPDEPAPLVLAKLASMHSGIPARELEARVATHDQEAINLLRYVASEQFPNLAVFDKPLTPHDMETAWDECCDVWGEPPELVVVDYVELVQAGETVPQKFDFLKAYGSRHEVPLIALHQASRSSGADGKKMTISSGAYGGEQQSTFVIGVQRRKAALIAELAEQEEKFEKTASDKAAEAISRIKHDLEIHEYTVTAVLNKNKRPGGGTEVTVDFELDGPTGRITPLALAELPQQYLRKIGRLSPAQQANNHQPYPDTPLYEEPDFDGPEYDDTYGDF